MSMSSDSRSTSFQPLLREVPPLNTKCWDIGNANTAFRTRVTHQSFSTAFSLMPVSIFTCLINCRLLSSGRLKNSIIILVFNVIGYPVQDSGHPLGRQLSCLTDISQFFPGQNVRQSTDYYQILPLVFQCDQCLDRQKDV